MASVRKDMLAEKFVRVTDREVGSEPSSPAETNEDVDSDVLLLFLPPPHTQHMCEAS